MTDKHTPCENCNPDGVYVELCPLHAAAPELLEALELIASGRTAHQASWSPQRIARDAIEAAKGNA